MYFRRAKKCHRILIPFSIGATPGPDLPMGFLYHCMAKIDQSRVILTGGADLNGQTLLVDISNEDYFMVPGPKLAHERH